MNVCVRSFAPLLAILALLGGVFSAVPAAARERHSKLDKVLQEAASHAPKPQHVIIRTEPGTRDSVKKWLQDHGDVIEAEHPSLDALTVKLHGEDLVALEHNSHVVSVSVDAEVTSLGAPKSTAPGQAKKDARDDRASSTPADLLRATLGLGRVAYGGSGVGVAVVDSGIEPTRDLLSSIRGFWDFTVGSGVPVWPYDDYGHGTHIAGLIASDGLESHRQFSGVAPDVNLFGFKVLDKGGRGRTSDVIRALEWILANHRSKGIHVVNLSLGHPIYQDAAHDPLVAAVENLVNDGVVVVVAAGNVGVDEQGQPGYAGITSPGNAPSAITVGAADTKQTVVHSDDRVAYFSSRGPSWYDGYAKPDIVAPGVALTSNAAHFCELFKAYPQLRAETGGRNFATLSGTSMAAAVSTGVVALLIDASADDHSAKSPISPNAVKAILQYTALPLRDDSGELYDALTQGTGEVNPTGALSIVEALDTSAPVGSPWISVRPATFTSIGGENVDWARSIIWDDTLVVNPEAIWINAAQWSACDREDSACENIVWGSALECDLVNPNCENIVWGSSSSEDIVWGSGIAWASDIVWADRILGMFIDDENIVWGSLEALSEENIVWGTYDEENIVWGSFDGENIVWGSYDGENIVWGSTTCDDAVDPSCDDLVWGSGSLGADDDENIVWGSRRPIKHGTSAR